MYPALLNITRRVKTCSPVLPGSCHDVPDHDRWYPFIRNLQISISISDTSSMFCASYAHVPSMEACPVVPGSLICCIVAWRPATGGRREGACGGKGTISERI